jgi:hypothetical protein
MDPKLLEPFGSDLGLAPNYTQQLLAENTEKATPPNAILDRKHSKDNAPQGVTVSSTVQTIYDYSVVHSAMSLHPQ